MSLVGKVGRRRLRARVAMFALYAILSIGAITTLYPFVLMVGTGFKGPTDQNDNRLVPKFWSDQEELYTKYLADKYAGDAVLQASTRLGGDASADEVAKYEKFLATLPVDYWSAGFRMAPNQVTSRLTRRYQEWLRDRYGAIEAVNRAYIDENLAFQTTSPPAEQLERRSWVPLPGKKIEEWRVFKDSLPIEFRIPIRKERIYQEWMRSKFQGQFGNVPTAQAGKATKFEELSLANAGPLLPEFMAKGLPARYAKTSVEDLWSQASGSSRPMPVEAFERKYLAAHASAVRSEFNRRNYAYVLDYILLNGRAVMNTLIFCLLAIGTQLFVNPLAAYALSRYPIKASGQILIFLLATMAFPAEVAMIPSFLLLKDLGMLNTFAALVLPTAASGYMIFLLKGFFDSLPQELFEAGQLDGAKESTLMLRVAFPLSRPVLGYLALLAFMGAYGAFIYAFLVVQDQKMWTLTVWLYQLQSTAPRATIMAAVALAALPTLVVFLAAQRVILRGIVLPGER